MKFKHWKEAEARMAELKTEMDKLNTEISTVEAEARKEDISVEKRDEYIAELQAKIGKRDALQGEYDDATRVRNELKQAEERQLGIVNNVTSRRVEERRDTREAANKSIYETREYEVAWGKSVLSDDKTELRELINTQDDAHAGYLIPTRLANSIKETAFTAGKLLALCDVIEGKGELEQPYLDSETDPEVHPEKSASEKVEKAIGFAIRRIRTEIIAEWIPVSRKFKNNDGGLFFDWLMVKLPQAIMRKQEQLILLGAADGSEGLIGILNEPDERFVAVVPADLDFNTANVGVAALDDGVEDSAVIVMNRNTFFKNVMSLRGTDGHPVYRIMTDNLNKPSFRFGGYQVIFNNNIKAYDDAAANEPYMLIGNFRGYTIQYLNGMSPTIIEDIYSGKKRNVVEYLSELECGGNILELGCFAKIVKE